jgi:hypothetical protein
LPEIISPGGFQGEQRRDKTHGEAGSPQGKIPCFVAESNAGEHDCKKIRCVPFAALTGQRAWFVTRLKKNARFKRVKKNGVTGKDIVSDYEIIIPGCSDEKHLRKIIARDPDTDKKTTLLTNNMKWAASTVSGVHKDRRQTELFFKAIKQNLKIKRFYGNSKNAVMTQIRTALIVYLLFYLLKAQTRNIAMSFTNFISVIKTMLFQRISLFEQVLDPSPPPKLLMTPSVQ